LKRFLTEKSYDDMDEDFAEADDSEVDNKDFEKCFTIAGNCISYKGYKGIFL